MIKSPWYWKKDRLTDQMIRIEYSVWHLIARKEQTFDYLARVLDQRDLISGCKITSPHINFPKTFITVKKIASDIRKKHIDITKGTMIKQYKSTPGCRSNQY